MSLLPVAILAGGLATRMRPLTETVPKALLDVAGRPFIDWQLEYLSSQGIREVVLCTGHLGEQIEERVGNGNRFGLRVLYSPDGPTLLGTGGALRQAIPLLGPAFFVLYGDSYLPIDFSAVQTAFDRCDKPALMTVLHNAGRWDSSNVHFQDGRLLYEKVTPTPDMTYIDYGLSVLKASLLLDGPPGAAFDLSAMFAGLSRKGLVAGYEVTNRFYEIGSPAGLQATIDYLKRNPPP